MPDARSPSFATFLLRLAALALCYALTAKIVLGFFAANGIVSMVWPPSGIALAALLVGGIRYWPGVFLGALAANLLADSSLGVSLCICTGNTLEAVIAFWLLGKRNDFSISLDRPRHFWNLVGVAALASWVSAGIGIATLRFFEVLTPPATAFNLLQWWQGDLLGMILVAPLLLIWRTLPRIERHAGGGSIELCVLLTVAFLSGQLVFLGWFDTLFAPIAKGFWSFLCVTWAAVRFGRHLVLLVLGMTAIQALIGAAQGVGFFGHDIALAHLENFWFFMAVLTLVGLSLASLMTERKLSENELHREKQFANDIISSLPGSFYMLDDQMRLVRWNRRLEKATGYSAEELSGRQALELIAEADRPYIAGKILQVFDEGEVPAEASILTRSGETIPYQFNSNRSILEGRNYLIGLGEDIAARKKAEQALRENEERFRLLFNSTTACILFFDGDGNVLMLNESSARQLGGQPSDFIGKSLRELMPAVAEMHLQRFAEIIRSGKGATFEDPIPLSDGTHWFSSHLQPVAGADGRFQGIQIVAIETTERRQMEDALRQSEELWKFALEGAGDAVWDWDVVNNKVAYTPRWEEMLGYDSGETGTGLENWTAQIHPDDLSITDANRRALLDGRTRTTTVEVRARCKNGQWKWILSRGMVVGRDAQGHPTRIVGTNADITLIKEHQKQLEHIAHFDALTNLPNRVLLADRLQQAMVQSVRREQSLAVAYLDLDGFKAINDKYGHETGDDLLVFIAHRMKSALRDCDTLARIGGDEFVAVLADLDDPTDCEPVLERLLQAAASPIMIGDMQFQVSASIGVTLYPRDGADADQLMRHADQAMYQAKQDGKNRYHMFDVEQDAAVQIQRESIEHIRIALERREFVLHYQPKVHMRSGKLVGVEALIRWQHPERGLLAPNEFLPVIEDQAISVALGEWVIDTALAQIAQWRKAGLDIPISVNVSAYHLQQGSFSTRLRDMLADHPQVPPSHLELEILETSAFDDVLTVSGILHDCLALGVVFALDDFGTGYSSLTYLRRLPADQLKIDQSFVRDMLDDPDDLAIVEGVVGLGLAFRRKVIAEGVETEAHGEMLLMLGCEYAQGYGIARPMPAHTLPDWAKDWRPANSWQNWQQQPMGHDEIAQAVAGMDHRHGRETLN